MAARGRTALVLLTAGCLLLILVPTAPARIVPQKAIMGIHLKERGTRVIRKKGRPDAQRVVSNEILGHQRLLRYGKTRVALTGPKKTDRVVAVSTKDPSQHTNKGVGVGSKESAVKNLLNGIRCRTDAGARHCFKGSFRPGRRVTDFNISLPQHRVTRVTVSFVVD
jgi:hypothetical protein